MLVCKSRDSKLLLRRQEGFTHLAVVIRIRGVVKLTFVWFKNSGSQRNPFCFFMVYECFFECCELSVNSLGVWLYAAGGWSNCKTGRSHTSFSQSGIINLFFELINHIVLFLNPQMVCFVVGSSLLQYYLLQLPKSIIQIRQCFTFNIEGHSWSPIDHIDIQWKVIFWKGLQVRISTPRR